MDETLRPQGNSLTEAQDELMNLMTIMYFTIQETLTYPDSMGMVRDELCKYCNIGVLVGYLAKSYSETRTSFDNVYAHGFCQAPMARSKRDTCCSGTQIPKAFLCFANS